MQNEKKWTTSQKTAIDISGKTLLVSAAAGSGKTAVLTARIVKKLTDKDSLYDISHMLVVTFTKAAATELKERIGIALTEALAENPSSKHLSRQLIHLNKAKICTIHSFCLDIIRSNFQKLGLPANFRVANEAETKLLYKTVMNDLIDDYYDNINSDISDFPNFIDNFVSSKNDDNLADLFLTIYKKIISYPDSVNFIAKSSKELDLSVEKEFFLNKWGNEIRNTVLIQFKYYKSIYQNAIDYIDQEEVVSKNYLSSFMYDYNHISKVIDKLEKYDYIGTQTILMDYEAIQLGRGVKKDMQTLQLQFFRDMRKDFMKQRVKVAGNFFSLEEDDIKVSIKKTAEICSKLYLFLNEYDIRIKNEKKRRSMLDFSDLEHYALKLLCNNNEPTETAKVISDQFDEIYIDEYQDINELQDAIFSSISKDNNRFIVGDIKQSIYGFRGAVPKIFSDYRNKFGVYNINDKSNATTLFLSNNFRCDSTIIDFTNIIFECLFKNNSGRIPYYKEDNLVYSKVIPNQDYIPKKVEISLIQKATLDIESDDDEIDGESDNEPTLESQSREAAYVASEIKKLIVNGTKPNDITILLRSSKSSGKVFEVELDILNIPYYNNVAQEFFENAEVLLMLCLLNCIDNPTRDIYFAGVLKSPLYGITLDELITIRTYSNESSLYEVFKKYTEETDFIKGKYFLEKLTHYRHITEGLPIDKLIWYLYRDTGILSLVYNKDDNNNNDNAEVRRSNLMLLYEYARQFESSSFKGLYNFILYINDVIEEKATLDNAKIFNESSDTVKIMTIHQSKGLEFPVCFLCDTSRKFNQSDIKNNLLIERELGIALKLRDTTGFARYDTPIRQAISLKITENQVEEEMRILYVALTRAKEKLYISALQKDPQKLMDMCSNNALYLSSYSIMNINCYIKWILTALLSNTSYKNYDINFIDNIPSNKIEKNFMENIPNIDDELSYNEYKNIINERFEFKYPYSELSKLPAKLSVSELYPSVLDENESDTSQSLEDIELPKMVEKPIFLEPTLKTATYAERGTATHIFMQFCDFNYIETHGIKEELNRLVTKKFITQSASELVQINHIHNFLKSEIYKDMKISKKVWREVRFNVHLPASQFTQDKNYKSLLKDENVLVQGVIDCFFLNDDDTITLIDYKTDYIFKEERKNIEVAKSKLLERHRNQLTYYKSACERISGKLIKAIYIYSFSLGMEIEVCF